MAFSSTQEHGKINAMSLKKILGLSLIVALLLLVGAFLWQVSIYFKSIRSGETSPIKRQQIQTSIERALSDPRVKEYLAKQGNMDDARAPFIGASKPQLTIVEFLDYGCPFCQAAFEPIRELVTRRSDEIRLVIRDFPVDDLHPGATQAAIAARCADKQGSFWPYHDKLFLLKQDQFVERDLTQIAREIGLDQVAFKTCLEDDSVKQLVEQDVLAGINAGVEGTPVFFFNGIKIQGALDRESLEIIADELIKHSVK